jgi:hypothetical protein
LKSGNKGFEAGLAAVEMARLCHKLGAQELRAASASPNTTGKSRRK